MGVHWRNIEDRQLMQEAGQRDGQRQQHGAVKLRRPSPG
jgi:general stress protein YciG